MYLAKKNNAKYALKVFSSELRKRTDVRLEKRKSGTQIVKAMTSKEKVGIEGRITMKLDHQNIVKIFEILENPQNMIFGSFFRRNRLKFWSTARARSLCAGRRRNKDSLLRKAP